MKVLIVFESDHGQAAKVAHRLADVVRAEGHRVEVARAFQRPNAEKFDAVVVGGSVHYGKLQQELIGWCRANCDELVNKRSAFFSVSVSARRRSGAAQREVAKAFAHFIAHTSWTPERLWPIAGALKYTQYPTHLKALLRLIAKLTDGDTDTSRDYEYTDWNAVDELGREFARSLVRPAIARAA
jgi:menaquinone-dependent protoporphyrinogen oxidase